MERLDKNNCQRQMTKPGEKNYEKFIEFYKLLPNKHINSYSTFKKSNTEIYRPYIIKVVCGKNDTEFQSKDSYPVKRLKSKYCITKLIKF